MSGFTVIILILFWALFALAVVSFMAYVYIQCMYYKWRKDERSSANIAKQVEEIAADAIDKVSGMVKENIENNS